MQQHSDRQTGPAPKKAPRSAVPAISWPTLAFFRQIVRRYFRRHFHAVRLSGAGHLATVSGPLIFFGNHSSWWDPMIAFLLGEQLLPRSDHFAPMDASALLRYPILSKIGVFPVEMQSSRGAVQFVRTSEAVLASDGVLWITPQGRFVDARERPLQFKPGLAALAARVGHCTLIPLAIEYTFWDERLPEALLLLGDPIVLDNSVAPITAEWLEPRLIADLERTMDHLRAMALTRQPASFEQVLATGTVGVGGFYGLGQRLRALLTGKPYRPEHTRSLPVPQDISRP